MKGPGGSPGGHHGPFSFTTAMICCDLHTHSTASDGTDTPAALAARAAEAGLEALALTDHDTLAGLPECAAACQAHGVEFVPGIELSADPHLAGEGSGAARIGTLHLLGLFVDPGAPNLRALEERLRQARAQRNPAIIENLNRLGIEIDYREVTEAAEAAGARVVGRPHIGQALVDRGVVGSVKEAFERFIGEGRPAYARRDRLPAGEAIEAIHRAGGLAILAHPVQLRLEDPALEAAIQTLREMGLDGLETRHSDHTHGLTRRYRELAERYGLLESGGSDYHGDRKPIQLGGEAVPVDLFRRLRAAWERGGGV